MKKNIKMLGLMLVVAALFVGCKWCPAGNPGDYTKIQSNKYEYDLTAGTGYYGRGILPTTSIKYGDSGDTYTFVAKEDMKIIYSEKLYASEDSRIEIRKWDGENVTYEPIKEKGSKSIKNKSFTVNTGDQINITFWDYMYSNKSNSTAWEFYLWAE